MDREADVVTTPVPPKALDARLEAEWRALGGNVEALRTMVDDALEGNRAAMTGDEWDAARNRRAAAFIAARREELAGPPADLRPHAAELLREFRTSWRGTLEAFCESKLREVARRRGLPASAVTPTMVTALMVFLCDRMPGGCNDERNPLR